MRILCYSLFNQFSSSREYDLTLEILKFRTFYSGREHNNDLFLVNVFTRRIECHTIMDDLSFHVPTNLITDFSVFTASNVETSSLSAKCVKAADSMCQFLDVFNRSMVCLRGRFSTV
jgi:hypothetical protein